MSEFKQYAKALAGATPEERIHLLREIAKNDLYFLAKVILGYDFLTAPVHTDLCRHIQQNINCTLYLLPRGHGKTTLLIIAGTIQTYLNRPTEPILIVCETQKMATTNTLAIRWHFEKNRFLRELFPDLIWNDPTRQSPKWTEEAFIMPKHNGRREPSFMAASLESQPTGLHFPTIRCDDLVTQQTCTNQEQIEKNRKSFGMLRAGILDAGGNIQIAGTIYHPGDLHCDMCRPSSGYTVYRKPAIDPDTGQALWPEKYNLGKLKEIRGDTTVSDYDFRCQYLLDPTPDDENAFFQLSWFRRYRQKPERLNIYAGIDCALSLRETADYNVIIVVGVDGEERIHVLDVFRGRWTVDVLIQKMMETQRQYKPRGWATQHDTIMRAIGPNLRRAQNEQGVVLDFSCNIPLLYDKMTNARCIQGHSERGLVVLPDPRYYPPAWLADLEDEIRRFPKGKHNDQVDCLGFIGQMLAGLGPVKVTDTEFEDYAEYERSMKRRIPTVDPPKEWSWETMRDPFHYAMHGEDIPDPYDWRGSGKTINTVDEPTDERRRTRKNE